MYIEKPMENTVYIRLLASKLFCGGLLLNFICEKYEKSDDFKTITLNSEPDAVKFYFKHKFVFSGGVDVDSIGVRYPHMVRATCKLGRECASSFQWFWPGIGYYLRSTYRALFAS